MNAKELIAKAEITKKHLAELMGCKVERIYHLSCGRGKATASELEMLELLSIKAEHIKGGL